MSNALDEAVRGAFDRANIRVISVNEVSASVVVVRLRTDHVGGPVRLDELVRLANVLNADHESLTVWDLGSNVVEVQIEIEERTPVEVPWRRRTLPYETP
jgi:hypothetical protein